MLLYMPVFLPVGWSVVSSVWCDDGSVAVGCNVQNVLYWPVNGI